MSSLRKFQVSRVGSAFRRAYLVRSLENRVEGFSPAILARLKQGTRLPSAGPFSGTTEVVPYSSSYVGHRFSGAGRHDKATLNTCEAGSHTDSFRRLLQKQGCQSARQILEVRIGQVRLDGHHDFLVRIDQEKRVAANRAARM